MIDQHGGPEVMRLDALELPPPGAGEARVRHTAIGINFIDTYQRSGLYRLPSFPHGLGQEAAGVVEAVGDGVREVAVGDRVAYAGGPAGAYAEARNVRADRLVPLPAAISDEVAAAVMLKGLTAEYLIRRTFRVEAGMPVLFHAAAGGVGLIACQWMKALGAEVIGTVSSDAKAEIARAHGCAHVIVYSREDFVARTRALTGGKGVPVVYDGVGRSTFAGSLDVLATRGMLVSFGNASGKPEPLDPLVLSAKGSLFLTRPTLNHYTETRDELLAAAAALFEVIASGRVRVEVGRRWKLEELGEAHRALEARETVGSAVVVP